MAFDLADPGNLTAISWYYVPDGTPALGVPTVFSSSTWDPERDLDGQGEVASSRQWWQGGPPLRSGLAQPGRCGSADQWLNGVSPTDPPPPLNPATGIGLCCGDTTGVLYPTYLYGCGQNVVWPMAVAPAEAYGGYTPPAPPPMVPVGEAYAAPAHATLTFFVYPAEAYLPAFNAVYPWKPAGEAYAVLTHFFTRFSAYPGEVYASAAEVVRSYQAFVSEAYGVSSLVEPTYPITAGEVYVAKTLMLPGPTQTVGEVYGAKISTSVQFLFGNAAEAYAVKAPVTETILTGFCGSTPVNTVLTAICTAADSGLSAFLGAMVTLTYDPVHAWWAGHFTVAGQSLFATMYDYSGDVLFLASGGSAAVNFNYVAFAPTCGPPFDTLFPGLYTGLGAVNGTTDWEISG